ncbi:hypothetical protein [Ruegeria sp. HKCCSP335]|uniref:hypothetical protein n=1 Tax=Ruegeria sp. HKCCSP335 TaxID=2794833 RepID=UPI001AE293C4|nr:hypothetical protein [Ruegeria sp. HKCCSP335]
MKKVILFIAMLFLTSSLAHAQEQCSICRSNDTGASLVTVLPIGYPRCPEGTFTFVRICTAEEFEAARPSLEELVYESTGEVYQRCGKTEVFDIWRSKPQPSKLLVRVYDGDLVPINIGDGSIKCHVLEGAEHFAAQYGTEGDLLSAFVIEADGKLVRKPFRFQVDRSGYLTQVILQPDGGVVVRWGEFGDLLELIALQPDGEPKVYREFLGEKDIGTVYQTNNNPNDVTYRHGTQNDLSTRLCLKGGAWFRSSTPTRLPEHPSACDTVAEILSPKKGPVSIGPRCPEAYNEKGKAVNQCF